LACGGTIKVLVEPVGKGMGESVLSDLVAARAARTPVAYRVCTTSWNRDLQPPGGGLEDRFRADRSGFEEDGQTFIGIH
ncbi:MAG: XdhC/CoxI family protein, partial [Pseudomonadota bacterium]